MDASKTTQWSDPARIQRKFHRKLRTHELPQKLDGSSKNFSTDLVQKFWGNTQIRWSKITSFSPVKDCYKLMLNPHSFTDPCSGCWCQPFKICSAVRIIPDDKAENRTIYGISIQMELRKKKLHPFFFGIFHEKSPTSYGIKPLGNPHPRPNKSPGDVDLP